MIVPRPKLLLVDDDLPRRLQVTSDLGARWDVHPCTLDDDPLKLARAMRPSVVLLGMERRTSDRVLKLSRGLRTDLRPIDRVGIYEGGSRRRGPWIAMELWMADGWLGLPADAATFVRWVDALAAGEKPRFEPPAGEGGALGRLRSLVRRG